MKRRPPKRKRVERRIHHPEYAQVIVHIPHALNARLNAEAEQAGKNKAAYVGDLLGCLSAAVVLTPSLNVAMDRWAKDQRIGRDQAATLLIMRALREMGVLV